MKENSDMTALSHKPGRVQAQRRSSQRPAKASSRTPAPSAQRARPVAAGLASVATVSTGSSLLQRRQVAIQHGRSLGRRRPIGLHEQVHARVLLLHLAGALADEKGRGGPPGSLTTSTTRSQPPSCNLCGHRRHLRFPLFAMCEISGPAGLRWRAGRARRAEEGLRKPERSARSGVWPPCETC